MRSKLTAYVLWGMGMLGFCGIHRLYTGHIASGLLWLCTGGLCWIGQLVDLLTIPSLVNEANAKLGYAAPRGAFPRGHGVQAGRQLPHQVTGAASGHGQWSPSYLIRS